ncbi:MAG: hypothetical protein JWQ96_2741 [Segetibacter sp.]|nr:hypothetical protein [Segetibacter sp.]
MQELIDRLTTQAGLSPDQAHKAIEAITGFVKEKFPMLGGAVDQMFKSDGSSNTGTGGGAGLGSGLGGFGGFGQ